jgi:hypothetical protein
MITGKTKLIVIAIFVALLGIGGFVANKLEAVEVGGACEPHHDSCTGRDAACLTSDKEKYCSISCAAAGDCPANMRCEEIQSDTYSAKDGSKTKTEKVKMCVKS